MINPAVQPGDVGLAGEITVVNAPFEPGDVLCACEVACIDPLFEPGDVDLTCKIAPASRRKMLHDDVTNPFPVTPAQFREHVEPVSFSDLHGIPLE